MEGEPEETGNNVHREVETTVLWEKYIQQSIIVDLSEDVSLHLSDLDTSFAFRVSQAQCAASEPSIQRNGECQGLQLLKLICFVSV